MDTIYRQAEAVLVWLGDSYPSDCLVSLALDNLNRLQGNFGFEDLSSGQASRAVGVLIEAIEAFETHAIRLHCSQCYGTFTVSLLEATSVLDKFWRRQWFHRLWVIQEVAMAASATFFYGEHFIALEDLASAINVYARLGQFFGKFFGITRSANRESFVVSKVLSFISSSRGQHRAGRHSLLYGVFMTMDSVASNLHDRIYAIRKIAGVVGIE